jgi:LmbE family N-acetylglucosaminyl deacetylase
MGNRIEFNVETAEVFVPDGLRAEDALARTTDMAVGAHQDDLEIMAFSGILRCFRRDDVWFCGVTVTDGSGAPRSGAYGECTDEQMRAIRRQEQKKAALVGEYGAQVLLDYPSAVVKDGSRGIVQDISMLLELAKPEVVYTHNLADKHDTHVAVALRVIEAIRGLPEEGRPRRLYGCEAWRGLDWMVDADRVTFDVSGHESLQAALLGVFDSQVGGGKRYDLATLGRQRANATYHAPFEPDVATGIAFAMDLTPLIQDTGRSVEAYVREHVDRFARDVTDRLRRLQT